MYKDILAKLYASLQSLEKCLHNSKQMLSVQKQQPSLLWQTIDQQESVLQHMRRVLTILQFEFAKENWTGIARQIQLFTGLQDMVRPDIMFTFAALANNEVALQVSDSDLPAH